MHTENQPASAGSPHPDDGPVQPASAGPADPGQPASAGHPDPDHEPVLPAQSREDTDAGWGEPAEPDDDERLYRDRPPHWDSI